MKHTDKIAVRNCGKNFIRYPQVGSFFQISFTHEYIDDFGINKNSTDEYLVHIIEFKYLVLSCVCIYKENAVKFQKDICFCLINETKAFDCVNHNKYLKTTANWATFYAYWSTMIRKQQLEGNTEQVTGKIGKGACLGCTLSIY